MSGEMADYALSEVDDNLERHPHESLPRRTKCAHCGAWPLEWRTTPSGWRLVSVTRTSETVHACDEYRAAKEPAR